MTEFNGLMTGKGAEVRVRVDLEGGGHIVAVFPSHGDAAFERAKKELLNSRFEQRGRKTKNLSTDARCRFFDRTCESIEGWQHRQDDGAVVDAMTLPDWQARFPVNLKVSIVSSQFEEMDSLQDEDREDLPPASDAD